VVGGYFWQGNPVTNTPATTISVDYLNGILLEITNLLAVAGISLLKSDTSQMKKAVFAFGTPASATAAGIQGMTMCDASFFYCCVATNSWKRVAIAAW
jgi:hypothetical protein